MLIYFVVTLISLCCCQKNYISPISAIYCVYGFFQAGVPFLYALFPNYHNYFIDLFSQELLVKAQFYTLYSLEAFGIAMIFFLKSGNKMYRSSIMFTKRNAVNDEAYVYKISKILFVITGVVMIPLYTTVAVLSIKNGFSQITRSLIAANGLFNLARAMFIPSFFLLIIYGKDKNFTKIAKIVFFYLCVASLLSGIRTDGILWLLTYMYAKSISDEIKVRGNFKILISVVGIVLVAIYIGQSRVGQDLGGSLIDVLIKIIGEMGFNFTTICFVMMYVPSSTPFQVGITYIKSFIAMFPNSLDFLHIFSNIENTIGCQWLNDQNHLHYGTLLDFGAGFSTIGESYMNFGWFGIGISVLVAFVVCSIFVDGKKMISKWDKYVYTAMFLAFLTFPRRAFNEFLSNIEYSVFLLGILLIVCYKRRMKS